MTTTNGKRNGRKTEEIALSDSVQTSVELEQLLENGKAAQGQQHKGDTDMVQSADPQPVAAEDQFNRYPFSVSSPQPEPTAEDLLKAAKKATRDTSSAKVPTEYSSFDEKKKNVADTVASGLANAVAQSANDLVETTTQAQQAIIAMMLSEGLNNALEAESAYQVGLLLGMAQIKTRNINGLAEQVSALRSHVNTTNVEVVGKTLENLGIGQAKEAIKLPLPVAKEITLLKLI